MPPEMIINKGELMKKYMAHHNIGKTIARNLMALSLAFGLARLIIFKVTLRSVKILVLYAKVVKTLENSTKNAPIK